MPACSTSGGGGRAMARGDLRAEAPETWRGSRRKWPRWASSITLEELRRRIINSLIAVAVGVAVCWGFRDRIYEGLSRPLVQILREMHMPDKLVYTNLTDVFNLYIELACLGGLFVASALCALSGLEIHFSRPVPARKALRSAFCPSLLASVHLGRRVRLLRRFPGSGAVPAGLLEPIPAHAYD